mgnify:CR=1 FL=1
MFSLLLTLGLLYLIGVGWAKLKDKLADKTFQWEQENEEKLKVVFSHLYVLSWKYYQVVDPEVIRFWKQSYAQIYDEHDGFEFYEIAQHLYGHTIGEECVKRALAEMIQRGLPVPQHIGKQYNKFIIVDGKAIGYSIDKEAKEANICRMPRLEMKFNHEAAEYAEDPYILSLMPPKRKYRSYHRS